MASPGGAAPAGMCLGGSEERKCPVDCWPGILHTLSASSSSSTQRLEELNKEGFALSKTRRWLYLSLSALDAPWAEIPALESTKHQSRAGDAAVWSHPDARVHSHGDITVLQSMFFRKAWATQSLHGVGDKPLSNESTWEMSRNLLKHCNCQYIPRGRYLDVTNSYKTTSNGLCMMP